VPRQNNPTATLLPTVARFAGPSLAKPGRNVVRSPPISGRPLGFPLTITFPQATEPVTPGHLTADGCAAISCQPPAGVPPVSPRETSHVQRISRSHHSPLRPAHRHEFRHPSPRGAMAHHRAPPHRLDTATLHPRTSPFRDFLGKIEAASGGQVRRPGCSKAARCSPICRWSRRWCKARWRCAAPAPGPSPAFVADADFSQLPVFYGQPIDQDPQGGGRCRRQVRQQGELPTSHVQVLGGWFDLGFNEWYSTKKPLNSLADLSGMKLRSPGGVLNSARIRFFGGIPNVTAWPDVPLALSARHFRRA